MRLATYNIHACIGADGHYDPGRTVRVLQQMNADVVALQEVDNHPLGETELLDYFAAETAMTVFSGPTLQRDTRHYGNALLTRLPTLALKQVDLSLPRREPRGAIDALLDWNGQNLQVVATHLGLRPGERRQQVRRLLDLYESSSAVLSVLLGDLNEWLLWGRPLRWLRQYFPAAPQPRTYPARFPLFALDRIWVHPRSAMTSLAVHDSPLARIASDHLPLMAQLTAIPHEDAANPVSSAVVSRTTGTDV